MYCHGLSDAMTMGAYHNQERIWDWSIGDSIVLDKDVTYWDVYNSEEDYSNRLVILAEAMRNPKDSNIRVYIHGEWYIVGYEYGYKGWTISKGDGTESEPAVLDELVDARYFVSYKQ
jgi:hypothetical protein